MQNEKFKTVIVIEILVLLLLALVLAFLLLRGKTSVPDPLPAETGETPYSADPGDIHGLKKSITSSWIVPEGFELIDEETPPGGERYTYYNKELSMKIIVWESNISELNYYSTTQEWLDSEYAAFMSRTGIDKPTYDYRNDTKLVVSGYYSNDYVYYIMEAQASPNIYSVTFVYPSGDGKDNCDNTVGQFMADYSYPGLSS